MTVCSTASIKYVLATIIFVSVYIILILTTPYVYNQYANILQVKGANFVASMKMDVCKDPISVLGANIIQYAQMIS
jgi:hypothetical protein